MENYKLLLNETNNNNNINIFYKIKLVTLLPPILLINMFVMLTINLATHLTSNTC